jgi:hypothetical protein
MDTRSLDLDDEHAVHERPADDISDTEEDELDTDTRVVGKHATVAHPTLKSLNILTHITIYLGNFALDI